MKLTDEILISLGFEKKSWGFSFGLFDEITLDNNPYDEGYYADGGLIIQDGEDFIRWLCDKSFAEGQKSAREEIRDKIGDML